MNLPPLRAFAGESDCQAHFEAVYCCGPITTFDAIQVRFRKRDFRHCFFESSCRDGIKDIFSAERAKRIDWIKAALQDPTADLFVGWDKNSKSYVRDRRVCVVSGNYVVVIALTGTCKADFITAYLADTARTIRMIRNSPKWK